MSHTPHELKDDFPGHAERISDLKQNDSHFARLMEEYHDVNRAVHRAETNVEPMEAAAESALRRKRMQLKDELYGILSQSTV